MITAFSQHNCGGSDAGTAAIIAATLWAVHYEMGMPLTSEALGRATFSESLTESGSTSMRPSCSSPGVTR